MSNFSSDCYVMTIRSVQSDIVIGARNQHFNIGTNWQLNENFGLPDGKLWSPTFLIRITCKNENIMFEATMAIFCYGIRKNK